MARSRPGTGFFFAATGWSPHVSDDEIADGLATVDPQEACDSLLKLTLERGASDNVSIIVVDCDRSKDAAGANP